MECGTLYLVATPIGNLNDMTYRAVDTLKNVDFIACEDTRHSLRLLNHFDIHKPLTSYFEHNKREKGEYIISRLKSGESAALVTDAGTPAISDPGEDLVRMCIEQNVKVVPVPGCAALINALIVSGQDTGRFCFEGFLSVNKKSRSEHLAFLAGERRTMIFYEAPHKLRRTLDDMIRTFGGDRPVTLVRELTKLHEQIMCTTLSKAAQVYDGVSPKGEYVIVLAGMSEEQAADKRKEEYLDISIVQHVDRYISGGMTKKDAIRETAKRRGLSRRDVYNEYENGSKGV